MTQSDQAHKLGVIIPTYRHAAKLPSILQTLGDKGHPCIVIDDGNEPETQAQIQLACEGRAQVKYLRRDKNGGKGAAVKDGLKAAKDMEWTHVIQVDTDGQHDLDAISALVDLSKKSPAKVICAIPVYDDSIPKSRKIGREITHFWVRVETLSNEISDSMCGLRIYPLSETVKVIDREFIGARMDFDTEILVQLNWRGLRVVEHPVRVTYPEENVSNFRMLRDNVRISLMHTRLSIQAPIRVPIRMLRRLSLSKYSV
jgi:glycosyltransferase involved in cell wall biosynthesis